MTNIHALHDSRLLTFTTLTIINPQIQDVGGGGGGVIYIYTFSSRDFPICVKNLCSIYIELHMGPTNLCCHTSLFICSLCRHVTFYKTLTYVTFYSFCKSPRRTSTTFKVAMWHFVFYPCRALYMHILPAVVEK